MVALLLAAQAAVVVHDGDELTSFVTRCLTEPEYAAELGSRARQIVAAQRGATGRTMELLAGLIEKPSRVVGGRRSPTRGLKRSSAAR